MIAGTFLLCAVVWTMIGLCVALALASGLHTTIDNMPGWELITIVIFWPFAAATQGH